MNYVFLGIFVIISALHLYASYERNQSFRNATKGMIILSLLGFYATSVTDYSPYVIITLLFYICGDLLLIPKNKYSVYAGGLCFGIANISYIIYFIKQINFDNLAIWFVILIVLVYLFLIILVMFIIKGSMKKKMIVAMFMYLLVNALLNCSSWCITYSDFSINNLLISLGCVSFFISDCLLYSVRFNKQTIFKSHFFVMLTYVIGQLLIILGIIELF